MLAKPRESQAGLSEKDWHLLWVGNTQFPMGEAGEEQCEGQNGQDECEQRGTRWDGTQDREGSHNSGDNGPDPGITSFNSEHHSSVVSVDLFTTLLASVTLMANFTGIHKKTSCIIQAQKNIYSLTDHYAASQISMSLQFQKHVYLHDCLHNV